MGYEVKVRFSQSHTVILLFRLKRQQRDIHESQRREAMGVDRHFLPEQIPLLLAIEKVRLSLTSRAIVCLQVFHLSVEFMSCRYWLCSEGFHHRSSLR